MGRTATLRTVFGLPVPPDLAGSSPQMGNQVNATAANSGRRFYSYLDRRVDVLVDTSGEVISFACTDCGVTPRRRATFNTQSYIQAGIAYSVAIREIWTCYTDPPRS